MYKILKQILHIFLFTVLCLTVRGFADQKSYFATSLDVYNITPYQLGIKWKSDASNADFSVYRSLQKISSPSDLRSASLIWKNTVNGTLNGSLYAYPPVIDEPSQAGEYYYAVLPTRTKYTEEDFRANINTSLWGVQADPETKPQTNIVNPDTNVVLPDTNQTIVEGNQGTNTSIVIIPQTTLTNLVSITPTNRIVTNKVDVLVRNQTLTNTLVKNLVIVRTNTVIIPATNTTPEFIMEIPEEEVRIVSLKMRRTEGALMVQWKLNRLPEQDITFLLYRDNRPVTTIKGKKPFQVIENALFYEDYALQLGRQYYYAVVLAEDPRISRDINMNSRPVGLLAYKDQEIPVQQEIFYEKRKLDSFKMEKPVQTNQITPQPETSPEKVVKKESTVKINPSQRAKEKDSWEDLQGSERPVSLDLAKGLSGKKEKNIQDTARPVPDNTTPQRVQTNTITLTNIVEVRVKTEPDRNLQPATVNPDTNTIKVSEVTESRQKPQPVQLVVKEEQWLLKKPVADPQPGIQTPPGERATDKKTLQTAGDYFKKEQYRKVLELLAGKQDAPALELKGKASYYLEDYPEALQYFQQLQRVRPQTSELWIKLTMNRWGEKQ